MVNITEVIRGGNCIYTGENMNSYVVGIDLGGTKIKGIVTDFNGNIISESTIPTNAVNGEKAVFERILFVIDDVIAKSKKDKSEIKAIGIGSPGPMDQKKGVIYKTVNLPFTYFELVKPISEKYNMPVFLDNDANVAAIAEYMFGAGRGTKNMVYVTVSTGIGGGAIFNGSIYRGNTGNALEIGHVTLKADGPLCNCGNYGCLEALASGTGIARHARAALESGRDTSLRQYENVTSYEVFKEAEKGDKVANEVLDYCLDYLGIGMANLVNTFDPEVIVIGGGVAQAGKKVFDRIKAVVDKRCLKVMAEACKIVPAELKGDQGAVGAAALAIMELK